MYFQEEVALESAHNHYNRRATSLTMVQPDCEVAHNYSSMKLNTTEQAHEKLRNMLAVVSKS